MSCISVHYNWKKLSKYWNEQYSGLFLLCRRTSSTLWRYQFEYRLDAFESLLSGCWYHSICLPDRSEKNNLCTDKSNWLTLMLQNFVKSFGAFHFFLMKNNVNQFNTSWISRPLRKIPLRCLEPLGNQLSSDAASYPWIRNTSTMVFLAYLRSIGALTS